MDKLLTRSSTAENLIKQPAFPKFVEHKIASAVDSEEISASLYEYLLAGNGLFLRAKRSEFAACLPICERTIRDLPNAQAGIFWRKPKISRFLWQQILSDARFKSDFEEFKEDVYVVFWDEKTAEWRWSAISRERQWASTIADDTREEYGKACLELHTHPPGALHFSRADDRDETDKFRIFGILIDIHSEMPKIRFRCGIYDFFSQIPADWVGEMPGEIIDLNSVEANLKKAFL